jgi:uncharacterized protein YggT (Ycf19 family)
MNNPHNNFPENQDNQEEEKQTYSSELEYDEQLKAQQSREESQRLRESNQAIKLAQQNILFDRIVSSIYFLVGLLEILLGLRFFLRLSGANPNNTFTQTIDNLSQPFVSPFSTLFVSPVKITEATLGKNIFDLNLLIAIIVYGILCAIGVWVVRYIQKLTSNTKP